MTSELGNWEEDLLADPEEEYNDLVRALKRTRGFSIFFIRCSRTQGKQIIARIKEDICEKKIEVLQLDKLNQPIENLLNIIEDLPNCSQVNVLFITGIEKSLETYIKPGYGGQGDYYKLDTVPRILGHLNLQRERFRDKFNICFVFILPLFALKYFIRRAPDFFDWRSGIFEFPRSRELVEQETLRIIVEGNHQKYLTLTSEKKRQKILEIQELIEEEHQTLGRKADLLLESGNLFQAAKEYEAAIASYDQVLRIKPDDYKAWYKRGIALVDLGRYEEALVSYKQAIELKPDDYWIWSNQGDALYELELYEEAITSYDKFIEFNSKYYWAWFNRGNALRELSSYEEAIASYNQAIELRPESYWAWNYQGLMLHKLGKCEEALDSFNKVIELNPYYYWAWFNRGNTLRELGSYEQALTSYNKAIELRPNSYNARKNQEDVLKKLNLHNHHEKWQSQGNSLRKSRRYKEAITSYNKVLEIKPDFYPSWYKRGSVLEELGRYEEAVASYDKALKIKPDYYRIWISRGDALQKTADYEEAIASYDKALVIRPDKYQGWNNRGDALLHLGRCEEAIAGYEHVFRLKPDFHEAWYNRGRALHKLGCYEEAIASYDKAIEIKPNLYKAWFNRSITTVVLKWKKLMRKTFIL